VPGIEYAEAEDVRGSPFRVALTSLPSLNSALRDSVGPPRSGTPAAWRDAIRSRLRRADYETLAPFVTPGKTLVPDPLLGLTNPPGESFESGLERMLATPGDVLAAELAVCRRATGNRAWDDSERDPQRWLHRYAGSIVRAWKAFEPIWRQARPALERERERVEMATAVNAQLELLQGLLPDGAVRDGRWCISCEFFEGRIRFPPDGLVLVPLVADQRSSIIAQSGDVVGTVGYAVRSLRDRRPPRSADPELEALLGVPRARILRAVGTPTSISDLATLLKAVPSAATHHVDMLEAAGLVARGPRGRTVPVRRTPRGEALVRLYDGAGL
jgi:DNA-binding transcriptional ArsR family regulator